MHIHILHIHIHICIYIYIYIYIPVALFTPKTVSKEAFTWFLSDALEKVGREAIYPVTCSAASAAKHACCQVVVQAHFFSWK